MDPEWSFGGLGDIWYQISHQNQRGILKLHAIFQLPSMIRSSSNKRSYLEDVDSS